MTKNKKIEKKEEKTAFLQIIRPEQSAYGTFGMFLINKILFGFTCERPWKDNKPYVSCILTGTFKWKISMFYPKNGRPYKCIEILNVEGRTLIKMHIANCPDELEGCIAPGMQIGWFESRRGVKSSAQALNLIMNYLKQLDVKKGEIEIKEII